MNNSQKGSGRFILIAAIAALSILGGVYIYNIKKTQAPAMQATTKFDGSASYDFMTTAFSRLMDAPASLTNTQLNWNTGTYETPGGKMIKETYPGHSFVITHSVADNKLIQSTWEKNHVLDASDIASRFEIFLKNEGFAQDYSNTGDATFSGSSGYTRGNIVCIISRKVTTPPQEVSDTSGFSSLDTITCADR